MNYWLPKLLAEKLNANTTPIIKTANSQDCMSKKVEQKIGRYLQLSKRLTWTSYDENE